MDSEPLFDHASHEQSIGEIIRSTDDQTEQLARVKDKLAAHVLRFCQKIGTGGRFHGDELYKFVAGALEPQLVAHGSVDRLLRDLRQSGEINFVVIQRRQSLYELTEIR